MVTQVALFNYRSHKTKPKFMNLEKGLEVISDVDRARMEVKMRGPAVRIRVCPEF